MPNPRANRPLTLDQVTADLKSLSQPAQALFDMMAGGLRGSAVGTFGAPGDIETLARMGVNAAGGSFNPAMPSRSGRAFQPVSEEPYFPSSEELAKRFAPTIPNGDAVRQKSAEPFEEIGQFAPLPMSGKALKVLPYALGRGAGEATKMTGQALSDAMIHQTGPLSQGPLSMLAPKGAVSHVVKPKGGNWMDSRAKSNLDRLKTPAIAGETPAQRIPKHEALLQDPSLNQDQIDRVLHQLQVTKNDAAVDDWVDRNLTSYVKNEMGTPEDRVRLMLDKKYQDIQAKYESDQQRAAKMAQRAEAETDPRRKGNMERQSQTMLEQATDDYELAMSHIAHVPSSYLDREARHAAGFMGGKRERVGFPEEGMGQSDPAKNWETMTDSEIQVEKAGQATPYEVAKYPWLEKLDPQAPIYTTEGNFGQTLGFGHIIDVLKEELSAGRITPEQLGRITMDQAVQRAADYDLNKAKKMRETLIKQTEGFPTHKEYPDGKYKWIELKMPEATLPEGFKILPDQTNYKNPGNELFTMFDDKGNAVSTGATEAEALRLYKRQEREQQLAEALKYEGDAMGHCVGGYCPDVVEGRSRIYSLRDKRGEPHVTVEVNPASVDKGTFPVDTWFKSQPKEMQDAITNAGYTGYNIRHSPQFKEAEKNAPPSIRQIKGKGNARPVEKYDPYTQDFVKSGKWSEIQDLKNTGLLDFHNMIHPESRKAYEELGLSVPQYGSEKEFDDLYNEYARLIGSRNYKPPEDGMKAGGSVHISDNPDTMMMELGDKHFAPGGAAVKMAKLLRAPAKTKTEIEAIAQRMAPQITGEYVRGSKGAKTVAGKTQKQFEREKTLEHDIRPTAGERPAVTPVDIESLKDNVMIGISGDPTITGQTVYGVAGRELQSPAPQHGGPLYGLGREDDAFWASNLGAASGVQGRVKEASDLYEAPVIGNYVKMGPDSYSYAQHFADTAMQAIDPSKMTKRQIEGFNSMIRNGYPYRDSKGVMRQRVFPSFPGIESPEEMYLHMTIDPELRTHFGNLMQMPTVTEKFNLPSGLDVAHAVSEPDIRDLEIGVTGKSLGRMKPEAGELKLSTHPTYTHDIPGEFIGGLKYPVPHDLMFPDTLKSVRENPKQAPQEFGSFKMVGPRQIIDPQAIDEIKEYEEFIKKYTGKKKGGAITVKPKQDGQKFKPGKKPNQILKHGQAMPRGKNPEVDISQMLPMMARGGEVNADDLILEERPL